MSKVAQMWLTLFYNILHIIKLCRYWCHFVIKRWFFIKNKQWYHLNIITSKHIGFVSNTKIFLHNCWFPWIGFWLPKAFWLQYSSRNEVFESSNTTNPFYNISFVHKPGKNAKPIRAPEKKTQIKLCNLLHILCRICSVNTVSRG